MMRRPPLLLLALCGLLLVPGPALANETLLRQAETRLAEGDDRAAERLLSEIADASLSLEALARMQLVRAEILLKRGQLEGALRSLPPSAVHVPGLGARIEQLRAEAAQTLGDLPQAVQALCERERYLATDAAALAENRERLWALITAQPLDPAVESRLALLAPLPRGWLDLALRLQRAGGRVDLQDWALRHPGHPATALLGRIGGASTDLPFAAPAVRSGFIAVLLPLSGALAASGEAVRDGLISAWLAPGAAARPALRFYDAGMSDEAAVYAYHQALREGAAALIGPLRKESVLAIARLQPPLPVLALNTVDGLSQPGLLQLALAPEHEARSAALAAAAQGLRRAAVLVPQGEWGQRVAEAFRQSFENSGGRVVSEARFEARGLDHSRPARQLAGYDASESRAKALAGILGGPSEFDPRGRDDLDLVFLGARASEAELILPQLRFYRLSRLPIFATASVSDGRQPPAGLRVCELPWFAQVERAELAPWMNPAGDAARLFALGRDAAQVLQRWVLDGGHRLDSLSGASGRLRVDPSGRIERELDCAPAGGGA
ncbi:MAG TPA: penicillin-binding protein activator [Nevskiaceae bacterium]|nr:penicillin-binding protein activator [Nevskiaceae bacterium]